MNIILMTAAALLLAIAAKNHNFQKAANVFVGMTLLMLFALYILSPYSSNLVFSKDAHLAASVIQATTIGILAYIATQKRAA